MKTQTPFWKLFKPKACSVGLKAKDPSEVPAELVGNLVKAGLLEESDAAAAVSAIESREQLASTGVGQGVAIPHVQLQGLDKAVVSLSVHKDGVEWRAIDGAPVHLYFTVLRPSEATDEHDPERHLEMMRWISRLARHDDFRRFALGVGTRTDLVNLLKEMAEV
jgi:mannitol/fructose-specific phosphotransferase system IIA component (Ntr-type)